MSKVLQSMRLSTRDPQGNERASLPADNVFRFSIVLSILLTLLYVAEAIIAGAFPDSTGDVNKFSWEIAPDFSKVISIIAVALGIVVNPIGTIGLARMSRNIVLCHFFLTFLAVLANLVVFVFLLMSGNGVVASKGRNVNSNDLDDKSVGINSFSDETQELIVKFALKEEEIWLSFQEDEQCCGFNLQAIYSGSQFGIEDFDFKAIHTGTQCLNSDDEIQTFIDANPDFNDATIAASENVFPFSNSNFFCERALAGNVKSRAQSFSVLFGLQAFIQVGLMFMMGLLCYSYEEKDGGLRPNEDPLETRPKVEDTVLVRAGYNANQLTVKKPKGPNVRF